MVRLWYHGQAVVSWYHGQAVVRWCQLQAGTLSVPSPAGFLSRITVSWLSGKASFSRTADVGSIPARCVDLFTGRVIPVT